MPSMLDISARYPKFPFFYDVDRVVGYNGNNQFADILLVQFLLKTHYTGVSKAPLGRMVCDGKFGPITHYWLLFFYHDIKADWVREGKSWNAVEVGNVMSIRDPRASGLGPGHTMIGQLNAMVQKFEPEIFNNMRKHPAVPAGLRDAFSRSHAMTTI